MQLDDVVYALDARIGNLLNTIDARLQSASRRGDTVAISMLIDRKLSLLEAQERYALAHSLWVYGALFQDSRGIA